MALVALDEPVEHPDEDSGVVNSAEEHQQLEAHRAGDSARKHILEGVYELAGQSDSLSVLVVMLVDPVQPGRVQ